MEDWNACRSEFRNVRHPHDEVELVFFSFLTEHQLT